MCKLHLVSLVREDVVDVQKGVDVCKDVDVRQDVDVCKDVDVRQDVDVCNPVNFFVAVPCGQLPRATTSGK